MENVVVKLKGTDLYVDGVYIGDLYISDDSEREEIISTYGLQKHYNLIMEA